MPCTDPLSVSAELFCDSELDGEKIQVAARDILTALGEDPDREGLQKTPGRVAKAYAEMMAGYRTNPKDLLNGAFFDVDYMQW